MRVTVFILVFLACQATYAEPGAPEWRISHYCSCQKCCGKYSDGKFASNKPCYVGGVACNWLPFGTKIKIDGKLYTVEDRGAKSIFGTKKNPKYAIDVYCASHVAALRNGVYYTKNVEVLK